MKTTTVFKGKIFEVVQKEMVINNKPVLRDIVLHSGGAAILAMIDQQILLVSQTRAGIGEKTLEIPAGMIEKDEDPKAAALRELNEETGLEADDLRLISAFYPTPGYDSEIIYVYEAIHPRHARHQRPMDPDEDIETLWMSLEEAYRLIEQGTIRDGKTILAVYYALLNNKERK